MQLLSFYGRKNMRKFLFNRNKLLEFKCLRSSKIAKLIFYITQFAFFPQMIGMHVLLGKSVYKKNKKKIEMFISILHYMNQLRRSHKL